jgi:hypothetical protein
MTFGEDLISIYHSGKDSELQDPNLESSDSAGTFFVSYNKSFSSTWNSTIISFGHIAALKFTVWFQHGVANSKRFLRQPSIPSDFEHIQYVDIPARKSYSYFEFCAALYRNPEFLGCHMALAPLYAEMGCMEDARQEFKEILRVSPHFSFEMLRGITPSEEIAIIERLIEAFHKAGLR